MGATLHALSTVPGPGYLATSTTSFTVGTGSITVTTQSGLAYTAGARVRISSSASPANYVEGICSSYSGTSLTITSDLTGGSGTFASWNINVAGNAGAAGAQGPTGSAFNTTSTTNLTIGTGSTSFTIASSGLPYSAGVRARAASAGNLNNFMEGVVTSYIGTTLVINVDTVSGSGTHADWNINIAGQPGTNGTNGTNGTGYLATSTTSQAIGTGAVTLVTQSGLAYVTGDEVLIVSGANSANYMQGSVTSYSGTSLVVNVTLTSGSGTHSDWNISLTGLPGPGYFATSATSLAIASGLQTFTTQSGLAYSPGAVVLVASQANSANFMLGTVSSYSGTTLIVNVTAIGGSGTHVDWNINASGPQGPTGPSGGLADPGGNGIVKRTALNTTAVAVGSDLPVMVASGASHSGGAVPDPGASAGTTRFLREDATWVAPVPSLSWTAPTLLNSWVNVGAGKVPAGYTKDTNWVYIQGCIVSGTTTDATTLFVLPSGYRPTATVVIPGLGDGAAAPSLAFYMTIDTSGNVKIFQLGAYHSFITISGRIPLF